MQAKNKSNNGNDKRCDPSLREALDNLSQLQALRQMSHRLLVDAVIQQYSTKIRRFLQLKISSPADQDDVFQAICLKIAQSKNLDTVDQLGAYVINSKHLLSLWTERVRGPRCRPGPAQRGCPRCLQNTTLNVLCEYHAQQVYGAYIATLYNVMLAPLQNCANM